VIALIHDDGVRLVGSLLIRQCPTVAFRAKRKCGDICHDTTNLLAIVQHVVIVIRP